LRANGDQKESLKLLLRLIPDTKPKKNIRFDDKEINLEGCDLVSKLELLIATAISQRIEIDLFSMIMDDCELSWGELYSQYVGKNVLNIFRQDYGYKKGTYIKIWDGREDNEHLVDIIDSLDPKNTNFKEAVYNSLQKAYPE